MKVLLAIDGSVHSQAAVAEVARGPWPTATEIRILAVIHSLIPLLPDPAFVIAAMHVEEAEDLRQRAPMLVDKAAEQVERGAGNVSIATKVLQGVPHEAIVQEARDWGADLVARTKQAAVGAQSAA